MTSRCVRLGGRLLALTTLIAGCGTLDTLGGDPLRAPTRPDDTQDVVPGGGTQDATDITPDPSAPACLALGAPRDTEHIEMFNLVNSYRQSNGLNTLKYSMTLQQAADQYAWQMFREGFFDHVAPDGTGPGDRALAAGYCDSYVGENLAYGLNQLDTAAEAIQGLKNSPSHNTNMLRTEWDYVGIGFLHTVTAQGDKYWWVQLFGNDLAN